MHERDTLLRVADTYRGALSEGKPPARAVELAFGLPRTTASRWVRRAREAGLLTERAAGYRAPNAKLAAVAAALGVDPERLRLAVLDHAGGDLRIAPYLAGR